MKLLQSISELPVEAPGVVATIGTFDGVHSGHRTLLEQVRTRADASGGTAAVVTFRPHPVQVLAPDRAPPLLSAYEDKYPLLAACGVDVCLEVPFDASFREWTAERFVTELLSHGLGATHVVAGPDLRFGKGATGDAGLLRRLGADLGFTVSQLDPVIEAGSVVSSTRIRRLILAGEIDEAARLLRRPHRLRGVVVAGERRGRELGYPTANLRIDHGTIPADGIYACRAVLADGRRAAAAVSVGVKPTFGTKARAVEAYLLDFTADLYGQIVCLDVISRLRDQVAYSSVDALVQQIERDVDDTRRIVCLT